MKHSVIIPILLISTICLTTGCKSKKYNEVDLSSTHTTAATTEAIKETLAPTIEPTTEEPTTAASPKEGTTVNVSAKVETYKSEGDSKFTIQYPVVSNMADASKQTAVNQLLKTNATAIEAHLKKLDSKVTADIKCKVVSVDRRRLTAVYTGSYTTDGGAYPISMFYTNTIDLSEAKSLGFNDYADGYTMAGYVMSNDCEFYNVSGDLKQALLDYRATQSLEFYTELFNAADFPLDGASTAFPESFSYVDQSILYFSIPVPHALGDYALIKFPLDGK